MPCAFFLFSSFCFVLALPNSEIFAFSFHFISTLHFPSYDNDAIYSPMFALHRLCTTLHSLCTVRSLSHIEHCANNKYVLNDKKKIIPWYCIYTEEWEIDRFAVYKRVTHALALFSPPHQKQPNCAKNHNISGHCGSSRVSHSKPNRHYSHFWLILHLHLTLFLCWYAAHCSHPFCSKCTLTDSAFGSSHEIFCSIPFLSN